MSTYLEDHTQPEPVITEDDRKFLLIDPTYAPLPQSFIPPEEEQAKPKRKRKEWVYKSEYDRLKRKYTILTWIVLVELIGLVIALKMAI